MRTKRIQFHGIPVTPNTPTFYADLITVPSGWDGTEPLYDLTVSLKATQGSVYFGYKLGVMAWDSKQGMIELFLKDTNPSRWGDDEIQVTFEGVHKNTGLSAWGTCSCEAWELETPDYETVIYNKPSVVPNIKANGSTALILTTDPKEAIQLTWDAATQGTAAINGYQVYAKISGGEWTLLTSTIPSVRTYSTRLDLLGVTRNQTVDFKVLAIDANSVVSNDPSSTPGFWLMNSVVNSFTNVTTAMQSASFNISASEAIDQVEISLNNGAYRIVKTVSPDIAQVGFSVSGLTINTRYTIKARVRFSSDGSTAESSQISFTTTDVTKLLSVTVPWNLEDPQTIKVDKIETNEVITVALAYRVPRTGEYAEVVVRSGLTSSSFTSDLRYTFSLTDTEKSYIYSVIGSDSNPQFRVIVKTIISVVLGEDYLDLMVDVPTNIWCKVSNNWRRALGYVDVSGNKNWRRVIAGWVKINGTWRRV